MGKEEETKCASRRGQWASLPHMLIIVFLSCFATNSPTEAPATDHQSPRASGQWSLAASGHQFVIFYNQTTISAAQIDAKVDFPNLFACRAKMPLPLWLPMPRHDIDNSTMHSAATNAMAVEWCAIQCVMPQHDAPPLCNAAPQHAIELHVLYKKGAMLHNATAWQNILQHNVLPQCHQMTWHSKWQQQQSQCCRRLIV